MTEFETEITAEKMKHAVNVLRRVNDEVIVQVSDGAIQSRALNHTNALMVNVRIVARTDEYIIAKEHQIGIGVDLERLGVFLSRAAAKDWINIKAEDKTRWYVSRGIHQRSMVLLDPQMLRKVPYMPELVHTATTHLSGKEFKEIVANALDVGDKITISAGTDSVKFIAESKEMIQDRYTATISGLLPTAREMSITRTYALDYLKDIAKDIRTNDDVTLQFATDNPFEVSYERDGVAVRFTLADLLKSE